MITVVVGTNRKGAVSAAIASYYIDLLENLGSRAQLLNLAELPHDFTQSALYGNSGKNNQVNALIDMLHKSDKFVFVVPEYNGSFPGVLKAFIDSMSYPSPFKGKKCALLGVSSGAQGGGLAISHLTDIFNYLGMHVLALKPRLAKIEENTNPHFRITNDFYLQMIKEQADALLLF